MKGKIGVIVEAMKRKISTAVDDLVHNKDLPFSPDVMRYHLSPKKNASRLFLTTSYEKNSKLL